MVSCIHEFISFEHIGLISDGAMENYTDTPKDRRTELHIDVEVIEDFKAYMENVWPKALDLVKKLSEQN